MKYLISFLFVFVLGCSWFEKEIVYYPKTEFVYVSPDLLSDVKRPILKSLDVEKSFANTENIEKVLTNTNELVTYIKQLEIKIKRYEEQIQKIKEKSNVK